MLCLRRNSRSTTYLDLNYNVDLGNRLTLGLDAGHTSERRYNDLSYTDYKSSLAKEFSGVTLTLALVGSNASSAFYQVTDSAGINPKRLAKTVVVIAVSKAFYGDNLYAGQGVTP